jgi:hypothetical protein
VGFVSNPDRRKDTTLEHSLLSRCHAAAGAAGASKRPAAPAKRKRKPLAEDEPISKLRKLLASRAKASKPRPRPRPPRPGLEILRREPKLGLLSVVAEVMDSEDDTPPGQQARKAAGEGAGTSAGVKKAKAGRSRKGDVAGKKVGKGARVKKAPKGGPPAGAGGSRGAGRQEAPSDTESDEDTMPIAKRAKLVSQDSVLKSGTPVGKAGEAPGRASSGGGEEETPVVRLAKLPAGLEKAMAARAAEKGDKSGGEGGRAGKEGGAGGEADQGGESEATVVELGETDGEETEESSPVTKTSTVNKLSRRKPAKGKEMFHLESQVWPRW